jgi:glyceraldehyde-3-phosphate dehydrogenase/erythrose-4-phosphate dehydrogenase
MTTRVGINGFGRIGRSFTRLALERTDLEVPDRRVTASRGLRARVPAGIWR